MNRFEHLLNAYREQKQRERKEKILMKSRREVAVNGNGTSGYTVTSGDNSGRVLKHISINHANN
jgi:hypothetical protein